METLMLFTIEELILLESSLRSTLGGTEGHEHARRLQLANRLKAMITGYDKAGQ